MLGWRREAIARGLLCAGWGQSQETDNVRLTVVRTGGVEELASEQLWLEDSEWPSCEIHALFSTRGAGGGWR